MSEDTTKDISTKYDTAPTIETVLEIIQELRSQMYKGFTIIQQQLEGFELRFNDLEAKMHKGFRDIQQQLEGFELRFDKLDDKIDILNGDVLNLRADARRDRRGHGGAANKQDEGTPANDTP